MLLWFFFFKQKTAYEMRISDWSSDVCSSDLGEPEQRIRFRIAAPPENPASDIIADDRAHLERMARSRTGDPDIGEIGVAIDDVMAVVAIFGLADARGDDRLRSEEHTSELQSLMRISYAVFCLKKKTIHMTNI